MSLDRKGSFASHPDLWYGPKNPTKMSQDVVIKCVFSSATFPVFRARRPAPEPKQAHHPLLRVVFLSSGSAYLILTRLCEDRTLSQFCERLWSSHWQQLPLQETVDEGHPKLNSQAAVQLGTHTSTHATENLLGKRELIWNTHTVLPVMLSKPLLRHCRRKNLSTTTDAGVLSQADQ